MQKMLLTTSERLWIQETRKKTQTPIDNEFTRLANLLLPPLKPRDNVLEHFLEILCAFFEHCASWVHGQPGVGAEFLQRFSCARLVHLVGDHDGWTLGQTLLQKQHPKNSTLGFVNLNACCEELVQRDADDWASDTVTTPLY
jgi:hypothetical protein